MTSVTTGKILSRLRNFANLSAQEASTILQAEYAIDLNPGALLGYESGYYPINHTLFITLCKIYHCNDILLAFDYLPSKKKACYLSSEEQQIIANYRTLLAEERNIILGALNIKKEGFLRRITLLNVMKVLSLWIFEANSTTRTLYLNLIIQKTIAI